MAGVPAQAGTPTDFAWGPSITDHAVFADYFTPHAASQKSDAQLKCDVTKLPTTPKAIFPVLERIHVSNKFYFNACLTLMLKEKIIK